MAKETAVKTMRLEELPALFRPSDLGIRGIPRGYLCTVLNRDEVERLGRGLFRLSSVELNEQEALLR